MPDHDYTKGERRAPLYLMSVDGKKRFYPIEVAGVYFDSGFVRVEIAGYVLEPDGTVRTITDQEQKEISIIADRHSESK